MDETEQQATIAAAQEYARQQERITELENALRAFVGFVPPDADIPDETHRAIYVQQRDVRWAWSLLPSRVPAPPLRLRVGGHTLYDTTDGTRARIWVASPDNPRGTPL